MEKINSELNFSGELRFDEAMSARTTFKIGGNADVWVRPVKDIFPAYTAGLLEAAREEGIPVFVLGGGANILVSDSGIRGIVLDTGLWRGVETRRTRRTQGTRRSQRTQRGDVLSGTAVDELVDELAEMGLSGVEFLAGMPGSVGGAVWMNARCYGKSVSDVLLETEILDENFQRQIVPFRAEDFAYKKSPFQGRESLILSASFSLECRDPAEIRREITEYRRDREEKGHFRLPSAGSAFKNNPEFGDPVGKIADELGLRGISVGGAQVAPWHGNIVVNTGNATARDVRELMDEVARQVKVKRGFELENEVLFVGEWGKIEP